MSFARYPLYRDSAVPALGDVPAHWRLVRLKHVADVRPSNVDKKSYDGEKPVRLCNYTDVYYNDAITGDLDLMEATATKEQIARFGLRAGDVIITKDSETANDIAISAHVPEDLPGVVCGYHLALLRPRAGIVGGFLKRLFDAAYVKAAVELLANGLTRVGLSQYALDNLELAVPPEEEQREIVRFVDDQTTNLDALVAQQQQLIALLEEKRQAIVTQLVLRGLSTAPRLRPSGVAWLSDVPVHWRVDRLATLLRNIAEEGVDELPILSVSIHDGVSDRELGEGELERKVTRSEDRSTYKRVQPGDLVYNMMRAWQGAFGAVRTDGMVSPAYVVARPTGHVPAEYLENVLRTPQAVTEMHGRSRGVTDFRLRLYWEEFKDMRVPVPPVEEIGAILDAVRLATAEIQALVLKAEHAIALLRERRAALISAAVSGQIDVRAYRASEEPVPA